MSLGTIETKVIAAAAGSGLGSATGGLLLWLAGVLIWHQPDTAGAAAQAVAAVPTPVSGPVLILLAVVGAAISGYAAPHTNRVLGAHSTDTAAGDSVTVASLTASGSTAATGGTAGGSSGTSAPSPASLIASGEVPPFQSDSVHLQPGSPDPFMEGGVAATLPAADAPTTGV